eukprot:scaffold165087_cov31-Tisochrysis_lutea.AAC.1
MARSIALNLFISPAALSYRGCQWGATQHNPSLDDSLASVDAKVHVPTRKSMCQRESRCADAHLDTVLMRANICACPI